MSPFEFVLIFFVGGLSLTYMVADDRSLTNAICQIAAIGLTHYAIVRLRQRFPRFALLTDGTPVLLLEKGRWQSDSMANMRIQDDDVMAAARDKGLQSLAEIDYAVLERNGEIAILPRSKEKTPGESDA